MLWGKINLYLYEITNTSAHPLDSYSSIYVVASNKTVLKKNASIKRQLDEQIGSIYSYVKSHNHEFNSRTPTLDSNLLYPYIKKIYRDYDITDPLATKSRYKTPSAKKAI